MTKKKRCLVIVGNVASGKSSVCGGLVARFEHYRHLSLDTFRHVAMGSGQVREQAAHALGLQFIHNDNPFLLFETTGTGRFFDKAMRKLMIEGYHIALIQLQCDPMVCLQRFYSRSYSGYQLPPYPYTFKPETAVLHIAAAHRELYFAMCIDTEKVRFEGIIETISDFLTK